MIEAFNNHYMENYTPGWISCIDNSMIDWLNKYCLGWMCIPRKPDLFGNEYHTIGNLIKGAPIMFHVELVEGKDRPVDPWPKAFEDHGKTVGLSFA